MKTTSVSLVDELDALADVIESAQLIAELLATQGLPDQEAASRAPKLLVSVLALASGRIRLLRKVALQELPSSTIVGRHNARQPPVHRWEDPDVLLHAKRKKKRSA